MDEIARLQELKLEHDPATPEVEDDASGSATPQEASTSKNEDGFIFGAATRLGGRILTADRDPARLASTEPIRGEIKVANATFPALPYIRSLYPSDLTS